MANHTALMLTEELAIGYGQALLFKSLDLQLWPGELICFMGSNGVGKTTLLKTLASIRKPQRGTVSLARGTSIAVVLTDKIQSYNMTVRDLVTFGRYPYLPWYLSPTQDDVAAIDRAISLVHLQEISEKNINEISDGQLQMALIGRALAQTTPILILDEPTAHLDLNNRLEIMSLLRHLAHTTQKAILIATHELDLALQTADRIWLATPDQKILSGIPEDLVLNGSFDRVFQFKGFDLKTGKVQHRAHRNTSLQLLGAGHALLWTKNALERSGYEISSTGELKIRIAESDSPKWEFQNQEFEKLETLLAFLGDQFPRVSP